MGVSLGYYSQTGMTQAQSQIIEELVEQKNKSYQWWCESIWMSSELTEEGELCGSTKLFCLIDDEDTDTYMAFLDIQEIVRFFQSVARQTGIDWRFEMEGSPFGAIINGEIDETLETNLTMFLDLFPGDFMALRAISREEILNQWKSRI